MTSCWESGDIIGTYHLWFLYDESLIKLCVRFGKHWHSLQKDMVRSLKAFIVYLYREIVFLTWMSQ